MIYMPNKLKNGHCLYFDYVNIYLLLPFLPLIFIQ